MRTETLFLDAGGVLLFPNWLRVADVLNEHGVRVEASALERADPLVRKQIDEPGLIRSAPDEKRGRQYFDLVLDTAGVAASEARANALDALRAYHSRHNLWETIPSDVLPALARLRNMGLRIAVVSNANGTLCAHFERLGLSRAVECVVDSADVGIEKPDPAIFEHALARLGARRETTVHVGDLYNVDVVGARAAGLRAVMFDPLDLYADEPCERVRSLDELATLLADGKP
ncbi:MAG TPA: HAD family hydrolase [Vicinamibacterales bacterium]|nr:HAD family hydrolase [Vicinamibacterales bacterium]